MYPSNRLSSHSPATHSRQDEVAAQTEVLTVSDLKMSYGQRQLSFPDVSIQTGKSCAVLGPSGCGKTTFLHLIAGLLTLQSGAITVAGEPISGMKQRARDKLRGREIGIVLQQLRLVNALTVMENLLLAQRLAKQPVDTLRAQALLQQLDVGEMSERRPSELSQGQAQRVAIARALVNQPSLLLADEPTSSLDDVQAENVLKLLTEMVSVHQVALVVVTHDARLRGHFDQEVQLS